MIQMILSGQNKVSAVEQGENRTSLLNLLDSQEHTGMREQANAFWVRSNQVCGSC